MRPAVIFDLDQTLIDTSSIEHFRKNGNWSSAIANISTLTPFTGIDEILNYLFEKNIAIVVITTSPGHYCRAIIQHFKWRITGQICYHDVKPQIKPHPEAFHKALRDYGLDVSKTISAGDRDIDIIASTAANIPSIACTWASPNVQALLAAKPTYVSNTPAELFDFIKSFLPPDVPHTYAF